ncbi:MAG: ERF family protein [Patescibacteria group bacterium]|nr:ERF family protein [Patescibacteria group bacterium]
MNTATKIKEQTDLLEGVAIAPEPQLPAHRRGRPPKNALVAAEPSSANISSALVAAASNPNVDAAKMRALWELHKEIRADEARIAFLNDFHAMAKVLPIIDKNGQIVIEGKAGKRGQNTRYAKYDDIHETLKPILDQFNFVMDHATEPNDDATRINVVSYLRHTAGHETRTVFPLPAETSGSKNNVQGWVSSNSYGKRINTINLLNINSRAPQDADRDGNSEPKEPKKLNAEDLAKLKGAIKFCGVGEAKFCEKFKIEKVDELPLDQFNEAMTACQKYAEKRAADASKES